MCQQCAEQQPLTHMLCARCTCERSMQRIQSKHQQPRSSPAASVRVIRCCAHQVICPYFSTGTMDRVATPGQVATGERLAPGPLSEHPPGSDDHGASPLCNSCVSEQPQVVQQVSCCGPGVLPGRQQWSCTIFTRCKSSSISPTKFRWGRGRLVVGAGGWCWLLIVVGAAADGWVLLVATGWWLLLLGADGC